MMLCGPARLYAQEAQPRGLYDAEVIAARKIPALEKLIPVLMDKAAIPGLQVALIYEGNEVWHKAFGVKSLKTKEPLNDETLFDGASLSKPVLAYTVMRLIDRGVFDLDTPLTRYRPYPDVKDDDRVNRITARMVLSHTTGFPNWRPRGGDLSIYFEPGSRFSYSGEGLVFLEKTLEHVTGRDLGTLVKQEVFDPLGMTRSSLGWTKDEPPDNLALGHNGEGKPVVPDLSVERIIKNTFFTTASDYARFVSAVLLGTGLSPESHAESLNGFSIRDELVTRSMGGEHPALEWLPFGQLEESQGADTVRQAIERGYEQYIKSFGEADAAGVAKVYAERGARLYAKGRVVRGRDAIQVDVARFLERVGPVTVTIEIEEFWVMDDTAYETGKWTYTYTPAGQEERTSRGRYLTAWKQQPDGDWKMWADISLPTD